MGKRLINTYIKYTAKKPILVFATIGVFMFLIFFISLTTKTSLIQSYEGTITENTIVINAKVEITPENIYIYENRNEAVYLINVKKIDNTENLTIIFVDNDTVVFEMTESRNIKIDIPIGEITLFERVFLKGGKVNG